jgi:hypothetical protein
MVPLEYVWDLLLIGGKNSQNRHQGGESGRGGEIWGRSLDPKIYIQPEENTVV